MKNITGIKINNKNESAITIIPNYILLLTTLKDDEKITLFLLSMIEQISSKELAIMRNVSVRTIQRILKTLLEKQYISKEKIEKTYKYYINTKKLLNDFIDTNKINLLKKLNINGNLSYNPLKELFVSEQTSFDVITKQIEKEQQEKIKKASYKAQIIKQANKKVISTFIENLTTVAVTTKLANNNDDVLKTIARLRKILKLYPDKTFASYITKITNFQNELDYATIFRGIQIFLVKIDSNELWQDNVYALRNISINIMLDNTKKNNTIDIHLSNLLGAPKEIINKLKENDNMFNKKIMFIKQWHKGQLKLQVTDNIINKVGKILNINGIPYLPDITKELYLYSQTPLWMTKID